MEYIYIHTYSAEREIAIQGSQGKVRVGKVQTPVHAASDSQQSTIQSCHSSLTLMLTNSGSTRKGNRRGHMEVCTQEKLTLAKSAKKMR